MVVAESRGDGVVSAPCMSRSGHLVVRWPPVGCIVEEMGEGGQGLVLVMGLKLQRAVQHSGVAGEET